MGRFSQITVTKGSGEPASFSEVKLRQSLQRSGAAAATVEAVIDEVGRHLFDGISTKKIYRMAFGILRKHKGASAARYQLKKAIAELGPTGYPFEQLVGELFRTQGYRVSVGQMAQGHCVQHELDVVAEREGERLMMECKFHSDTNRKADVKVPLYIRSRFLDVEAAWLKEKPGLRCEGWVVTNARFTADAMQYGECVGLRMLSWDHPSGRSLKTMVDSSGLHPITCLTGLRKAEKQELLGRGIVLCRQLADNPESLDGLGIPIHRAAKVIEETEAICREQVERPKP